ncbi:MAG: IS110 family transposase [Chloroflexi bacterium]|nr:IS110 family transposase [Chloroflexota bacterium]
MHPQSEAQNTVPSGVSPGNTPGGTQPFHLGLDMAFKTGTACLLDHLGRDAMPRWTFPNSRPGAEELVTTVVQRLKRHGATSLVVGMEATGIYGWHLACFLSEAPALRPWATKVFIFNPHRTLSFKRALGTTDKTDKADAGTVAQWLRVGLLPAPFAVDAVYGPLQRLTRFRYHLSETLTREKLYTLGLMYLAFSEFSVQAPLKDPFGATSQAVLEEFSLDELVAKPLEELSAFLARKGHGRIAQPDEVAKLLQQAARDSYRLDKVQDSALRLVLSVSLTNVKTLSAQLRQVDALIARELKAIPLATCLLSVPGLGPVYSAGMMAEIQNIHRFEDHAAVAKFAGLVWRSHQSGDFIAEETPLAKTGNTYLRYYLVEGANSVRVHEPEYAAYYQAKYKEATKHHHKRLVRLVDALLRPDLSGLYVPPEQRHGGRAVMA